MSFWQGRNCLVVLDKVCQVHWDAAREELDIYTVGGALSFTTLEGREEAQDFMAQLKEWHKDGKIFQEMFETDDMDYL